MGKSHKILGSKIFKLDLNLNDKWHKKQIKNSFYASILESNKPLILCWSVNSFIFTSCFVTFFCLQLEIIFFDSCHSFLPTSFMLNQQCISSHRFFSFTINPWIPNKVNLKKSLFHDVWGVIITTKPSRGNINSATINKTKKLVSVSFANLEWKIRSILLKLLETHGSS